jgi:tetratricopeptide (TPR) repeat protein
MTSALDLLEAHKYQEAADAYGAQLAIDGDDGGAIDGLAAAHVALGRYREAIPLLWKMDDRERARGTKHCGRGIDISCAHWCLGEQDEALRIMHAQCAGILDRSIGYAPDGGGGSTMGVLLHYMAVTLGDAQEVEYAIKYLEKLKKKYNKRPFDTPYPSHLVKYILGLIELPSLLEGATRESDLELATATATAPDGLSKRRNLCEVLFHAGVMCRKNGDEAEAQRWFSKVYNLPNPIIEQEWYLARFEIEGR